MRSWKSWNLLITAALFGAAGCGGESGYDATGGATQLADAICERAFACCDAGENTYYLGPYVTADNCAERLVSQAELTSDSTFISTVARDLSYVDEGLDIGVSFPNLAVLDRAAAEGRVRLDGTALNACLEYLRMTECNAPYVPEPEVEGCDPTIPVDEVYPCSRDELIVGLVGEGGPCDEVLDGQECADGLVCVYEDVGGGGPLVVVAKDTGANGTCERPKKVNEGCFFDYECEEDLYCSQLDGTCQEPRALGEDCQYSPLLDGMTYPTESLLLIACEPELTCSPFTNTCVAPCAEGTACWGDFDCDDKVGLVCVQAESIFGPQRGFCDQPRAAGEDCFDRDDCAAGLTCDAAAYATEPGTCVALTANDVTCGVHGDCLSGFCDSTTATCEGRVAVPNACPTGFNEQCVEGARCADLTNDAVVNPTCVALLADTEACTLDVECLSAACIAGACRTLPLVDGAECESDNQCESDECNSAAVPPVCVGAPLPNASPCDTSDICASRVCFGTPDATCQNGAPAGTACAADTLPCDPSTSFCDIESDNPVCTAFKESGESCTREIECRSGDCALRFNRWMCEAAAEPDALVCDGPAA